MLRQLAQYHAKDPNNLFMVRLAQVGGDTQKKDKVDLRFSRASCLFLSKWPLTVASLVRPSGSDSPGQRHAHPLPVPQRPAADESGRRGRTAHRARLLPRRQEQLVHPPPPDAASSALCSRVQRWRSISFNPSPPSLLVCSTVILGKSHYILYGLVAAMQPRMLVTFDEELRPLPVSVRVGQVKISINGEK